MNLKPFFTENLIEAGCDEAGRGCIAGPVVAAAVILPRGMDFPEFDDSKKLTENQREKLRVKVLENAAAYGVGIVSAEEIDEINILNASFLAMHRAIDQLKIRPAPTTMMLPSPLSSTKPRSLASNNTKRL